MTLNTSVDAVTARRRELVGRLRLRGLTQREITQAVAKAGIVNPRNGKPYSLTTIHFDIDALQAEWRQHAQASTAEHIANVLSELREVRRVAWETKNLKIVLQSLQQERDLLGLDAPRKIDMRHVIQGEVDRLVAAGVLREDEAAAAIAEAEAIIRQGVA